MLHSLPLFHRIAGTRIVVVGESDMAEAKARLVERAGGIPCAETEAHHAQLAFVALEDERAAQAAALRLKRLGLLVNVADRPDLCDFTLPSVLERGPVLVAVSTGGASAGLAKHLRLRLEAMLPENLGALAQGLAAARDKMRQRFQGGDERRRAVDAALGEGGPLDPFVAGSENRIDAWLSSGGSPVANSTLEIQLTSEDPEDLSIRQARALGEADHVLHDPEVPDAILIRARADAARHELPCADQPENGRIVILRI